LSFSISTSVGKGVLLFFFFLLLLVVVFISFLSFLFLTHLQ
jgi:hypothetical protein